MVSMKDIARECSVSIATVSKVLNGGGDIGQETRRRVMQTAERMGYQMNSAARALKTHRTYNLGVLFFDERHSGLGHVFFSTMLESVRQEAEKSGYDITFISGRVARRKASYLQHCRYRGVDGVVIACVDFRDPLVVELVNSELPVVTIDHVFNNRIAVLSDNVNGMATLVRHAVSLGHRKIAFVHGEMTSVTENRLLGFHRACAEAGLEIPDSWIRQSGYHDADSCYHAVKSLIALKERPTCIVLPDDYSAIGGMNALRDAGLRVPQDISVIGYDGVELSQILTPKLTTYRQDASALGSTAASKLVELIENPKTTLPEQVVVSGKLLEGASVRRLL